MSELKAILDLFFVLPLKKMKINMNLCPHKNLQHAEKEAKLCSLIFIFKITKEKKLPKCLNINIYIYIYIYTYIYIYIYI